MIDLAPLSLDALMHLQTRITDEIEKRRACERTLVVEELTALARAHGFKLNELLRHASQKPAKQRDAKPAQGQRRRPLVKYRHPHHPEFAWTGRGRKPKWFEAWLAEGKPLSALSV